MTPDVCQASCCAGGIQTVTPPPIVFQGKTAFDILRISPTQSLDDKEAVFSWLSGGSSYITLNQLSKVLKQTYPGLGDADVLMIYQMMDKAGDGQVSFDDFVVFSISIGQQASTADSIMGMNVVTTIFKIRPSDSVSTRRKAFNIISKGQTSITRQQLQVYLQARSSAPTAQISALFAIMDKDGDGSVDFREFLIFVLDSAGSTRVNSYFGISATSTIQQKLALFKEITGGVDELSFADFKTWIQKKYPTLSDAEVTAIWNFMEKEGDGKVSFNNFVAFLESNAIIATDPSKDLEDTRQKNQPDLANQSIQYDGGEASSLPGTQRGLISSHACQLQGRVADKVSQYVRCGSNDYLEPDG